MGSEWYCKISGREIGPLSSEQFKSMASAGQFGPTDHVKKGEGGRWLRAGNVQGLFEADQRRSLPVAKPLEPASSASLPVTPSPAAKSVAPPPVIRGQQGPPPAPPGPSPSPYGGPIVPAGKGPFESATSRPSAKTTRARRQQQNMLMVAGAVVLGVVVVAGGAFLALRDRDSGGRSTPQVAADSPSGSETPEAESDRGATSGDGRRDEEYAELPGLEPEPSAPGSKRPGAPDVRRPGRDEFANWTDASKESIQRGDVEVSIRSVGIGTPPEASGSGKRLLLVAVELRNTSTSQAIEYRSWDGSALLELPVALSDDLGNRYRQRIFRSEEEIAAEVLPEATVMDLTDDSFEVEVLQAAEPVLVDFWAAWCPNCPPMAAIVERVGRANAGRVKVAKVNVDNCPRTKGRYGIHNVPTVILFNDGQVVEHYRGGMGEAGLQAAINVLIPPKAPPAETLDPQQAVEEVLVFERPAGEVEFLRIELPGGAIGARGTLDFLIPKEMIDRAAAAS